CATTAAHPSTRVQLLALIIYLIQSVVQPNSRWPQQLSLDTTSSQPDHPQPGALPRPSSLSPPPPNHSQHVPLAVVNLGITTGFRFSCNVFSCLRVPVLIDLPTSPELIVLKRYSTVRVLVQYTQEYGGGEKEVLQEHTIVLISYEA
ncbi:hypothetical protein HOY80DRAFT_928036, partial [Tuber brumale]